MTTLEKFNRTVIELIQGVPYDEAIKKEEKIYHEGCQAFSDICGKKDENGKYICDYCRRWRGQDRYEYKEYPITIGRVMQAIKNYECNDDILDFTTGSIEILLSCWKLTKENGKECDSSDQTEETLLKILEILK